jgi:predicted branched-subunit amino acid permease
MVATSRHHHSSTTAADLAGGARAMAPWLIGVAPFGLVIGVSAAHADVPLIAGWLSAPLIFSGSAQVATIGLLSTGAAPVVVVLAALAINLRLVLYSATMAAHWKGMPRWWQALAAYLLVDPTLAVGVAGYEMLDDRRRAHRHYLGGGIMLWVAWLAAVTLGATLGAGLPAGLRLELVVPLFLTGEVVHRLRDSATVQAAAVAAAAAVVTLSMPLHVGPIVAITAGIAAGLHAERRETRT